MPGHTGLVALTVWIDDWQMQCCGKPFAVGSAVEWTLHAPDRDWLNAALDAASRDAVDAVEEHHGRLPSDAPPTCGIVIRIDAIHCRFAREPGNDIGPLYPVPGSGRRTPVEVADGWTPDKGDLRFIGYLVELGI